MIAGRYDPTQFELLLPLTLTAIGVKMLQGALLTAEFLPDGSGTVEMAA